MTKIQFLFAERCVYFFLDVITHFCIYIFFVRQNVYGGILLVTKSTENRVYQCLR